MLRRARRHAVSLMAAGMLLVLLPGGPPARAVTLVTTGWWWRAQTRSLPAPLPPPPTVGDDQLLVEGTPEGATAWAGVSYTLADGETAPILTIVATEDSFVPDDTAIVAFRASVPFREATAGVWENRPLLDLSASVRGVPDGPNRWVFPVAPLVSGPELNIVLAPGFNAAVPSTFSMRFARPTAASVRVTPGESPGVPATPTPTLPNEFITADTLPPPDVPAPAPVSVPAVPDAPAVAPQDRRPGEVAIGNQIPNLPSRRISNDVDSATRIFGALLLLAGAAFAVWSWSAPAPAMVGLGRFRREAPVPVDVDGDAEPAEPQMGGLGRFARPRTEPPPPLT